MSRATDESLKINFEVMSIVGWTGDKLNDFEIEKLKKDLKEKLQTLIYDSVLELEDDWGDSRLYDFSVVLDVEHYED